MEFLDMDSSGDQENPNTTRLDEKQDKMRYFLVLEYLAYSFSGKKEKTKFIGDFLLEQNVIAGIFRPPSPRQF